MKIRIRYEKLFGQKDLDPDKVNFMIRWNNNSDMELNGKKL
jgi:hypothetical protein